MRRMRYRLFWFGCFLILFGCGSDSDINNFPSQSFPINDVAGTWKGTATHSGGLSNITLSLLQTGTDVSGSYLCSNGTVACARPTGDFSGRISGTALTGGVVFPEVVPNGASCSFHGTFNPTTLNAQYSCNPLLKGEQGEWNLTKQD